jgi:hypothetical protein
MPTESKPKYWLSWYEKKPDYRPLTYPPNEHILGWWCSGYGEDDDATICALVAAPSEQAAWNFVEVDWPCYPKEREIRFIGLINEDFRLSDRFQPSKWMIERGVLNNGKVK